MFWVRVKRETSSRRKSRQESTKAERRGDRGETGQREVEDGAEEV